MECYAVVFRLHAQYELQFLIIGIRTQAWFSFSWTRAVRQEQTKSAESPQGTRP